MDETRLKGLIAGNIVKFRKQAKLTQAELAEKLNYSDKAISKWERAEAIPDVCVLKQLADIFKIQVDDFFDHTDSKKIYIGISIEKRIIISIIACLCIFLAATVIFAFFIMFKVTVGKAWLCFIWAAPASALSFLIFSSTWKKHLFMAISGTILTWTMVLALFLSVVLPNRFIFFVIGAPVQVIIMLWYTMVKLSIRRKRKTLP